MTCFSWILALVVAVLVMVSLIRWFEQVTEAVEQRWWNKVFILVVAPFTVWFFPSKIAAGRPSAVPRHEPVRGFGRVSLSPDESTPSARPGEGPPPGTPKEFTGLPPMPPKQPRRPTVEADKIEKLKQKMREQGMIDEQET